MLAEAARSSQWSSLVQSYEPEAVSICPHFTLSSHKRMPLRVADCPIPSVGGHTSEPLKSAAKKNSVMVAPPEDVATVSVSDLVAVSGVDEESATSTVRLNWPGWDVVPEIVPPLCSVSPLGSVPEVKLQ